MKNNLIDELIDFFLKEKRKGMGFTEIRRKLESKNISEDQIKYIIRCIDNQILSEEKLKYENKKARDLIYAGVIVTTIGLIITVGTFTGIIMAGNHFIIAFGPVLVGLSIMFSGLGKYRKD